MPLTNASLKSKSRSIMAESNPSPMMASLFYLLFTLFITFLETRLLAHNMTQSAAAAYMQYVQDGNLEKAIALLENMQPSDAANFIRVLLEFVSSVVSYGLIIFYMNSVRYRKAEYGNLMDGFGRLWSIFKLNFLRTLLIALWSLLLIVPGFIAAYRYRMSSYLMLDHPDWTIRRCLAESKAMMDGHKRELFVLDMSFFGWFLLSIIPYVSYPARVWSNPYINITYVLYYELLCGKDVFSNPQNEAQPMNDFDTPNE